MQMLSKKSHKCHQRIAEKKNRLTITDGNSAAEWLALLRYKFTKFLVLKHLKSFKSRDAFEPWKIAHTNFSDNFGKKQNV